MAKAIPQTTMITEFLLNIFTNIINFVIDRLPTWSFPDGVLTSISELVTEAYSYDKLVPIDTLIAVLLAVFGLFAVIWAWSGFKFLLGLLRGN